MRKKIHIQNLKMYVLFLILLCDMSNNFTSIKNFIFSEKFGSVYFSLTCLSPLTNYPADIPYYSLAVFTVALTEISCIKNKKHV
jgi:hypothetical protein